MDDLQQKRDPIENLKILQFQSPIRSARHRSSNTFQHPATPVSPSSPPRPGPRPSPARSNTHILQRPPTRNPRPSNDKHNRLPRLAYRITSSIGLPPNRSSETPHARHSINKPYPLKSSNEFQRGSPPTPIPMRIFTLRDSLPTSRAPTTSNTDQSKPPIPTSNPAKTRWRTSKPTPYSGPCGELSTAAQCP